MSKKFLTPVQLPADPTNPLEAVTKQYVDAHAGSEIEISTADPIGTNPSAELWYDSDDPGGGVVTPAFDGTPTPVDLVGSPGTLNNWARGDHTHAASAYTPYNGPALPLGVVAAAGVSTSWARGDHVHPMPIAAGRNLFDNSQMVIKQRTATQQAQVGSTYLADRWNVPNNGCGASNLTYGTLAAFGATGIPAGRPRPANIQYTIMTTAEAAGTFAAGDWFQWNHAMEGQFLQHLNWGTAGAQPLTWSADVYSSIATTYVVELLRNEATQRVIAVLLPVPSGWSTQKITFPGDTASGITNDNSWRLQVAIWIAGGSAFTSGTLQTTWGNVANANRAAGLSNVFTATVNNVFSITNAQLEIGTQATPYEVRRYDDELRACLRYYRQTAVGMYGEGAIYGYGQGGSAIMHSIAFPVPMRVAPSFASGGTWVMGNCTSQQFATTPNHYNVWFNATATGLAYMYANNSGYLMFNAEI